MFFLKKVLLYDNSCEAAPAIYIELILSKWVVSTYQRFKREENGGASTLLISFERTDTL